MTWISGIGKVNNLANTITCQACNKDKAIDFYRMKKGSFSGYLRVCIDCENLLAKKQNQTSTKGTPPENLTGKQFGLLTPIEMMNLWENGGRVWKCLCSCGTIIYFSAYNLKRGAYTNCGCQLGSRRSALVWRKDTDNFELTPKIKTIGQVRKDYKQGAKSRNLEFHLTDEEIDNLVWDNCVYCGEPPHPFNGIDRIDSSLGYFSENVVTCCETCNRMKHSLHKDKFIKHLTKIKRYLTL